MNIILLITLVLVFSYAVMHYSLSTFWKNATGVIIVSAVFAVLVVVFVSVFGSPALR